MKLYKIAHLDYDGSSEYDSKLASNPDTAPEILKEILEQGGSDWASCCAANNKNCPASALEKILKRGNNDYISEVAAKNPNCPALAKIEWMQTTGQIGKEDPSKHIIEREEIKEDPDLQKLRDLISNNNSWYKKSQENYYTEEIANNPNTSSEILEKILEQGNSDYISCSAARNYNCTGQALEMVLKRGRNDSISRCAAENPNCPIHILEEILKRGKNDSISCYASLNPNCPTYLLEMILKRGKNDNVSYFASKNPNCPLKSKIQWMQATGQIGKEDPSKHIIEHDEKEIKEDEDLKKLRDLIAKNNSWYKKAQEIEDYYTIETAQDPNTSPEILKKILEQGDDDFVSRNAAENPNCPAYLLEMVLKRGNDDLVSRSAARNPNCPASALEMVLKRENNDYVSRYATLNPNCPALAKIQWMKLTGKIGQFDPSKHIMESDEKEYKEDPDLQKLRDLIAKNNNWYKTAYDADDKYNHDVRLAINPNTAPEILESLLKKYGYDSSYVVEMVYQNPNCPIKELEAVIMRGETNNNDYINISSALINPSVPISLLEEICNKKNWMTQYAAKNPNCPAYCLEEILSKGEKNSLSWVAHLNPNCPLKAKIDWMRATGYIGKEDPSKHIIEREEIKEDEDLQKLRDLIANNNSWHKTSQLNEDYYTKEIARNPNTSPEILKKILKLGNDDEVSRSAVLNHNCPPEILLEVLKRGEYDWISICAARNPNCPSGMLVEILKRGKEDYISQNAASNPNCPSEMLSEILRRENDDMVSKYAVDNPNCPDYLLEMVLKRGNDDWVSRSAVQNPNCPALAKIRWMQLTGKIGKEDPSKHIIEKEEVKEDEDLQKLRALISKNTKNVVIGQNKNKPEKKPYRVVKVMADHDEYITTLKDVIIYALSPEQARMMFLQKYSYLRDYLDIHIPIEVRFDKERWEEMLQTRQREKEKKEEFLQNAWWNQ